jgi:hypothetical protein
MSDEVKKHWYASKTVWFNVLAVVATIATGMGYTGEVSQELTPYMPVIQGAVNIVLRLITSQAVGK